MSAAPRHTLEASNISVAPQQEGESKHDDESPTTDASPHANGTIPPSKRRDSSPGYALNRNYAATTRLNSQFLLWKWELGYSLHPSTIPPPPPHPPPPPQTQQTTASQIPWPAFRVADLATGTAIWMLDVARTFPLSLLDGYDISLEQCPPPAWLPDRITLKQWDVFSPTLPPELEGIYDVVHIRLLLLVVRDNDPRPLLRNALRMLRPGGWIQWDEIDVWNAYTVGVAGDTEREEGFQRKQELTPMSSLHWVKELEAFVTEVGFHDVKRERVDCNLSLAKYYQDMQFLVMEEEAAHKDVEGREMVERAIAEGVQEGRKGRARVTPKVVVLGRKSGGPGE